MKITKKYLKRIIQEEYSKLRKQGLISELINYGSPGKMTGWGSDNYPAEYEDTDFSEPSGRLDKNDLWMLVDDLMTSYNHTGLSGIENKLLTDDYGGHLEEVVDGLFEEFEKLESMGKISPEDANSAYDLLDSLG